MKPIKFEGNRCPEKDNCRDANSCAMGYYFEIKHDNDISPFIPLYVSSATHLGYNVCMVKEKTKGNGI